MCDVISGEQLLFAWGNGVSATITDDSWLFLFFLVFACACVEFIRFGGVGGRGESDFTSNCGSVEHSKTAASRPIVWHHRGMNRDHVGFGFTML